MSVIRTQDLTYTYSQGTPFEKVAVDSVSLEIEKGSFIGVIGHTGSGKSTLVQHFNGLLRPTSGQIFLDGEDMWANPKAVRKFRFKVGLVFQYPEYQLFEETVYKDIAFGPTNMGLSPEEVDQRVQDAARFSGVDLDWMEKSPFELSGGQKRRVAIAGVMAMDPEVLVLDEPTAGLDPRGREQILTQIREFHKERGTTVLLVSHNMEDVANYCDQALVMNQGKIAYYDTVEKVFSHGEEISRMGLDIPQVSRVFQRLHQMGYPVDPTIFTVAQARDQMLTLLGRKEAEEQC